jgi:hypothetical protein
MNRVIFLRIALGAVLCILIYLVAQRFAMVLFPHFPTAWTLLPGALVLALVVDYLKGKGRS